MIFNDVVVFAKVVLIYYYSVEFLENFKIYSCFSSKLQSIDPDYCSFP